MPRQDLDSQPDARRFKRFPIIGNCRLFVDNDARPLHAIIDNVNVGGIGIFRREPLPLNSAVRVELKFLDKNGDAFIENLQGKIVQITPKPEAYLIGIAFKELITQATHPQLITYLREKDID